MDELRELSSLLVEAIVALEKGDTPRVEEIREILWAGGNVMLSLRITDVLDQASGRIRFYARVRIPPETSSYLHLISAGDEGPLMEVLPTGKIREIDGLLSRKQRAKLRFLAKYYGRRMNE